MIVDLTQEELWKIQEYVRKIEGEHTHLYWDYEWMHKVHRGIMYLADHTKASTYDLHIEDTDFWWLVVQQIPAGLMVGADKEFGRKLLKKVIIGQQKLGLRILEKDQAAQRVEFLMWMHP